MQKLRTAVGEIQCLVKALCVCSAKSVQRVSEELGESGSCLTQRRTETLSSAVKCLTDSQPQ